jgi:hypothetical protein
MNHDCGFFNKIEWARILDSTKAENELSKGFLQVLGANQCTWYYTRVSELGAEDFTRQVNESNYEILQKPEMSYVDKFYIVREWNLF